MTAKPMIDAEIVRMAARRSRARAFLSGDAACRDHAEHLERIAKRLEEIDAPKFVIPLHHFQACSDAGVPITGSVSV